MNSQSKRAIFGSYVQFLEGNLLKDESFTNYVIYVSDFLFLFEAVQQKWTHIILNFNIIVGTKKKITWSHWLHSVGPLISVRSVSCPVVPSSWRCSTLRLAPAIVKDSEESKDVIYCTLDVGYKCKIFYNWTTLLILIIFGYIVMYPTLRTKVQYDRLYLGTQAYTWIYIYICIYTHICIYIYICIYIWYILVHAQQKCNVPSLMGHRNRQRWIKWHQIDGVIAQ